MTEHEKYMRDKGLVIVTRNQYNLDETDGRSACPLCSKDRQDPEDKCVALNWDKGIGKCFNCDKTIQLHETKYGGGTPPTPESLISEPVKDYLKGRGISVETLVKAKIGGEHKKIIFNFIKNGKSVKEKTRTTYDKAFLAKTGGESVPYNIDSIDGLEEIIITEGEIDALSFMEIGFDNVISVPNGANSRPFHKDYFYFFRNLKKVYIVVDQDEAGNKLGDMLEKDFEGKELVRVKCGDVKDANDYLQKYGSLELAKLIDPKAVAKASSGTVSMQSNLLFNFEDLKEVVNGKLIYQIPDMEVLSRIARSYVSLDGYGFMFPKINGDVVFGSPIPIENFICLIRDAGYKSAIQLRTIMQSPTVKKISTIGILHHQLKNTEWDGKDRIEGVIKGLSLKEDRGKALMRKWFVNALAFTFRYTEKSLVRKKVWNKLVPILVSSQRNWYKTTAVRKLGLQGHLQEFFRKAGADIQVDLFTEWAGNLPEDKRELNIATSNSFIINIDDIDNMLVTERGKGKLRSLISQEASTDRVLYSSKNSTSTKNCVYIGSSNKIELLRDIQETRYLPLLLEGPVDKDYFRKLDGFQFWAQIYNTVINSEQDDLNLTKDDLDSVKELTNDFIYETGTEVWMADNFEYDTKGTLTWDNIITIVDQASLGGYKPSEIRVALSRMADSANGALKAKLTCHKTKARYTGWRFKYIGEAKIEFPASNLPF